MVTSRNAALRSQLRSETQHVVPCGLVRAPDEYFVDTAFSAPIAHPYTPLSAAGAFASLVTVGNVGANRYLDDEGRPQSYQDPYDTSQIAGMRAGEAIEVHNPANWVLPVIPQATRAASYDTDFDGMADAWELRTFGDLSQSYNDDHDSDGYTNIEEFMNQVDAL